MSQPSRIGRYQITRLIGRGGMGHLYLAHDPNTGREVAIKVLSDADESAEFRARFAREARVLASLNHPNIVHIYDTGDFEGSPFIVMEYVPGETVEEMIKRRAPLAVSDKLRLITELLAGLAQAHDAGIVHRDIKPANLIVDQKGQLKILDFGIARVDSTRTIAGQPLTMLNVAVGTPGYMAPEQLDAGRVDHRSDIFAVGAVCYELLAYAEAFPGSSIDEIEKNVRAGKPVPLSTRVPDLDPELDEIVMRALRGDPDKRYQDAATFERALSRLRDRPAARGESPTRGNTVSPTFPRSEGAGRRWRSERSEAAYRRAFDAYQAGNLEAAKRFATEAVREDHTSIEARDLLAKLGVRSPGTETSTAAPPAVPPAVRSAPTVIGTWADSGAEGSTSAATFIVPPPGGSTSAATIIVPPTAPPDRNTNATRTVAVPARPPVGGRLAGLLRNRSSQPARPDEPFWVRHAQLLQLGLIALMTVLVLLIVYFGYQWAYPPGFLLTIKRPFHGTLKFRDIVCGANGSTCSTMVPKGETVQLSADAEESYSLFQFTDDCRMGGSTVMSEPRTCGATFEQAGGVPLPPPSGQVLTIAPRPQGGRVRGPNGLDCGGSDGMSCSATIPTGQPVTLQAYPDTEYSFDQFTGDCTRDSGTTTMITDHSCGAVFKLKSITTTTMPYVRIDAGAKAHTGSETQVVQPASSSGQTQPGTPGGGVASPQGAPASQGGQQPQQVPEVVDPTKVAKPETDDEYARKRIRELIGEWCAGYEALDPAAVQRAQPRANVDGLRAQFDQYVSLTVSCPIEDKAFVALDNTAGTAKAEVPFKKVILNKVRTPKQETYELVASLTLSRPQGRAQWFIDTVVFKPKKQ